MNKYLLSSLSHLGKKSLIKDLRDFYIPYRSTLNIAGNNTFGCEIEFKMQGYEKFVQSKDEESNYALNYLENKGYNYSWYVTCEENNHLEIVSDVLTDCEDTWNKLDDILSFLISNGAYYSGVCGAHVHVGKQILQGKKDNWEKFLMFWSVFEDVIIKFTNGEEYAERPNFNALSKRCANEVRSLVGNLDDKLNAIDVNLYNKMSSLNLNTTRVKFLFSHDDSNSYNVQNTVEFRSPNGTLNKVIWQNNINFFCKMMQALCDDDFDLDLLYYLFYEDENKDYVKKIGAAFLLSDLIFTNEFDKFCFLRQYYKDFNDPKTNDTLIKSSKFWR